MKTFENNDTVEILPSHYDFYLNHPNIKEIFVAHYPVPHGSNESGERIDPDYYVWQKMIPEMKTKKFKGTVLGCNHYEDDKSYYIKWITKHGEITEWILAKHLKNITAKNKPKEI